MKINTRIVASLFLVCIVFFFLLACLDYVFMSLFNIAGFAANADLLYKYWMVLGLVVVGVGFAVSLIGYITKLPISACVMFFFTFVLLFAGGLLDEFYALLAYIQGQQYSFSTWSAFYKWGLIFWNWPLQILWSMVFYGVTATLWYLVLKKKK